ncbi:peptidase M23 [Ostreiculturibacter nitratireducens]|uniref:murein hydrolase activator EnvC family protein n=1 Tax=Ostreiculturibacter nitratireducens TaxID=3075226 RepID=UPI0031B58C94
MRQARAILLALALFAPGARAEEGLAASAMAASESLRAATDRLDAAQGASDRVAALTATIRAYEDGLAALRGALRRTALREEEIRAEFEAERVRLGRLLGAMTAIANEAPGPLLTLHPEGPEGTVRAGMILSDVTPALQAEAEALRADLEEIAMLRDLQENAAATVLAGLASAQAARTALSQAMQDRTDLPRRYLEDPEEIRKLVESADTLEGFAVGLATMETDIGAPMDDFEGARGSLPMPVHGTILRRAGEADAAGITRPGIVITTLPQALVTAPWPATIRYRGPLLDYENVMIVEPAEGYLLVLAGLGTVYGETGDVVAAGTPLGLMGGADAAAAEFAAEFLAGTKEGGGNAGAETLYIELREGKEPVDPLEWFAPPGSE